MTLFERIVNWLFPAEQPVPHQDERDQGFAARMDGHDEDANPFPDDADKAQAWADGWNTADAWARGQF